MGVIAGIKFCTVDDVKNLSTVHQAFTGLDDRIQNYIRAATTQVIAACNREFIKKTNVTEYHPTPDRKWEDLSFAEIQPYSIYLREPKVVPDSLQVFLSYRYIFTVDTRLKKGDNTAPSVDDLEPGNFSQIDGSDFQDYYLENIPGNDDLTKVVLTRTLQAHPKSIKIVYNSGYDADGSDTNLYVVPFELVQATAIQAGFLMSRAGNEDVGSGDVSRRGTRHDPRTTPSGITPEANFLLRKWRRSVTASM